jgi:hypothetical protein
MPSSARITRVVSLLLLIPPQSLPTRAQERGYLDATQVKIRQRQRDPATGTSGGVFSGYTEGKPQATQALALALKFPEGAELASGEAFEYEVQIRNVSDRPVKLPWDLSQADIEATDPSVGYEYQTAAISVGARVGSNRAVTMEASILLFGSPSITTTMMRLEPGDWVRIKAKGRNLPSNPNEAWPTPNLIEKLTEGELTATLILSTSSFTPGPQGNLRGGHEESRITGVPILSSPVAVQFRF